MDVKNGFQWKGVCDATVDDVLNGTGKVQTKTMQMEEELKRILSEPVLAEDVLKRAGALGISERTVKIAKNNLSVVSEKVGEQWYWRLPDQGRKGVTS